MRLISGSHVIVGVAMLVAAGLALAMKPTERVADRGARIDLEAMIPKSFGEWQLDARVSPLIADPQTQAAMDKIYNQTLARTYVNARGERVMLAIAYGGDQSDAMQVHKPEVCYPAGGFQIWKQTVGEIKTDFGAIPVKRLVAAQGTRIEPISYWIRVGDEVSQSGLARKLEQLRFGLTGKIPDGLLFRVSAITPDDARAFALHQDFVIALLAHMPDRDRIALIGGAAP